jgi:hypothetical protein
MSIWKVYGAKVQGPSHVQTNTPCQDAFSTGVSSDGQWVSMVVSDGAGSAARAEEGSQLVAKVLSEKLLEIAAQLSIRVPGGWINDSVIQQVIHVRELLREKAGKDDIRDFHCTLVAALVGPSGGFLIHIGDGSLISGNATPEVNQEKKLHITINHQSKPENGEYANETFFITEKDWIKHLRISPIGKTDWIMLATDGGCALSLQNESVPHISNLQDIFKHLLKLPEESRSPAIQAWLETDGAKKLSNDDKTLVICLGSGFNGLEGHEITLTNSIPEQANPVVMQPEPAMIAPNAQKQASQISSPQQSSPQQTMDSSNLPSGTYQIKNKSNPFNLKIVLLLLTAGAVILLGLSQLQNILIPTSSRAPEVSGTPKPSEIEKKADAPVVKKPKEVKDDQAKEAQVKEDKVLTKTKDDAPVQNNEEVVVDKKSQTVDTQSDSSSSTEKAIKTTPTKNKDTKKDVDKSTKAQ